MSIKTKRIGAILLMVVVALSVIACSSSKHSAAQRPSPSATTSGPAVDTSGATILGVGTAKNYTLGEPNTVTVAARDASGKVATAYRGTIHFTSTDKEATLPDDYTFTDADQGVHAFKLGVTFGTAGQQAIRARDTAVDTITGRANVVVTAPASAT